MGVVYLARDVLLERPVAIKLLAPSLAARDDMRRRFLREARLAAQCFHPHIVPIHEVAEAGELAWFVMAYVAGETLAERLQRAGTLPPATVQRIGRDVGWALAYAHERGVVHRDVKPENILLEEGTDRALIADFGIAVGQQGPHASGEVAGTARFMAPEQALGEPIDGRADLYALGVTLYLAATGRYPFDGGSAVAILAQQQAGSAAPVREVARQLPDELADAIDRCLAPRATDRFDDAHAFVAALERTRTGDELPREARDVRAGVLATASLADWAVAIGLAGFFLVMGEHSGSIGRAIMSGVAQGAFTLFAAASALRAGETLLALRRAAKAGLRATVLSDALAPAPTEPLRPLKPITACAMLVGAFTLALLQAKVDPLGLPEWVEFLGNVITWFVPPVMIHRALTGARQHNGSSGWFYSFVRKPIADRVARWFTRRQPVEASRPVPASAPTEVRLGQAAAEIFARLEPAHRASLRALPAAMTRIAEEAVALRARLNAISGEQRAARQAVRADHDARIAALAGARREVEARLGTNIAALESIRLDLLRLHADRTAPGAITEQLDAVHELQRQVDAAADVRRLLRDRAAGRHDTPSTPVPA